MRTAILMSLVVVSIFSLGGLAYRTHTTEPPTPRAKRMFDVQLAIENVYPMTTHTVLSETSVRDLVSVVSQVKGFDYAEKQYPGMGTLIEQLGPIINGTGNKYWQYYVNGTLAPVGVDEYELNENDTIEWRFEAPQVQH